MPFVTGFLRARRRWRPGRPDTGLPGPEEEVDPGYGVDEGRLPEWPEGPEVEPPEPPVGIWPPLTPEHPWRPVPPFPDRPSTGPVRPQPGPGQPLPPQPGQPLPPTGGDERPDTGFPPGAIWPPLPPGVHGKYVALVLVGGMPGVRYRYVIIDADAELPKPPVRPTPHG